MPTIHLQNTTYVSTVALVLEGWQPTLADFVQWALPSIHTIVAQGRLTSLQAPAVALGHRQVRVQFEDGDVLTIDNCSWSLTVQSDPYYSPTSTLTTTSVNFTLGGVAIPVALEIRKHTGTTFVWSTP